jgi:hypothetical protein
MYRIPAENKNEFLSIQIEIRPLGIRGEGAAILSPPDRLDFSTGEPTPQKKSQKIWDLN